MTDTTIAKTILEQLGGKRFRVMTGTHGLMAHPNALSMRLRRNQAGAMYLKITLDPSDTYTMEVTRSRGTELIPVETVDGIYFDQLQEIFTRVTGLVTTL